MEHLDQDNRPQIKDIRSRGVESQSSPESRSRSLPFEIDSESRHVLLLDFTLSLVLCGFGQYTLAGCATSSMCCYHTTLLQVLHSCAPFIRRT